MNVLPVSLLFILLFAPATAYALENATITFVPERFSANSSVVVMATGLTGPSIRVAWQVAADSVVFGQLPPLGNKWACYFSAEAGNTCGPTPFQLSSSQLGGNYTLIVSALSANGQRSSRNMEVDVGSIPITERLDLINNTLLFTVWPQATVTDVVEYKVYYAGNVTPAGKQGVLEWDPQSSGYKGYGVCRSCCLRSGIRTSPM